MLGSSHKALVVTERKYLRQDWCKSRPLQQNVSADGCESRTFVNRFCYGQCNSFYIPRRGVSGEEAPFRSCAFCRPQRTTLDTVELLCPDAHPHIRYERVTRVKTCRCAAVPLADE
uniref:gremlin-2-like n=1 Tax=Myxine glutinosa TaxID=7769 RepID=UPI00358F4E46